jgi:hypothetical protein
MDHVDISDDDELYRRIHPGHINPDTNCVSSGAFVGADSFNLSVDLARLTTPKDVMDRAVTLQRECIGVVSFTARSARQLGFEVVHDPLPETDPDGPNPAHCLVKGEKERPKRQPARALARTCRWVWPPDRVKYNPVEDHEQVAGESS